MKFDEAGHGIEIGIAAFPDINKILFVAGFDFESVHCDKHRNLVVILNLHLRNGWQRRLYA
jgi:hypothetical protein